jgi:hypothetical protein
VQLELNTLVTITRNEARQFRNVLQRALGRTGGLKFPVEVLAGPDGLMIRCQNHLAAIQYHQPGTLAEARLILPAKVLEDFGGRDETPVTLEANTAKQIAIHWTENSVPQYRLYDEATVKPPPSFPALPEQFAENPPGTLKHLDDACQNCADESIRFALTNFLLRGERGQVVATDGRHAFRQSGFSFPWQDDFLVPRTRVFGSKELDTNNSVQIARLENWAVFQVGPWTIWLAIDRDGKFPRTDDLWPILERATSRVELTDEDARFLAARIGCLPGDQEVNFPVTLDLNGEVIVRGKSTDQPQTTDLVLSGSRHSGPARRLNTGRMFVARALRLGFREFFFFGDSSPLLAVDGPRQYLWMPLAAEDAATPSANAIRILSSEASHLGNGSRRSGRLAKRRRPIKHMKNHHATSANSNGHTNGQTDGNGQAADQSQSNGRVAESKGHAAAGGDSLLEQAYALRSVLRDTLTKTNELVLSIKRHKRQSRLVKSTLASLRQLQSIDT